MSWAEREAHAGIAEMQPQRGYHLRSIASVKARPITWLLPGRIPYGSLTVLAGRPGQGKSQLTMTLAAMLSRAGVPSILVGAEDGLEDTVKPRLLANAANVELIHAFEAQTQTLGDGMTMLPTDVPLLEQAVKETGAGMLVIDPFAAHLSPELNSANDHSLRQATAPLADMARRTGVAVVIVAHLKKSREGSPMDWVGGSIGLTGAARSALLFGEHAGEKAWETQDNRYLYHVKLNGAQKAPALLCRIEGVDVDVDGLTIATSRVHMVADVHDTWAGDLA